MTSSGVGADNQAERQCLACGEPVKDSWKVCPACEAPIGRLACPGCGAEVKENWRVCPECETRLKCPACGRRLLTGQAECPNCRKTDPEQTGHLEAFIEPLTGMEFVLVPAGTFQMGDLHGEGWENEAPLREVCIERFYLGKYPVTQGQWERVMAANPSMFAKGPAYPVEQVSWTEVEGFIRRLNEITPGGRRFRLPTEAEWEYAARSGGRRELYAGGEDIKALGWCAENSEGSTQPVGLKAPNGLELFDMSGNVWEWCQDVYAPESHAARGRERLEQTHDVRERVIRGGSWNLDAWSARCSRRFGFREDYFGAGLGFRLASDGEAGIKNP
jgi:formylglycine-generating enzyme required for sulfatase activity